VSASWLQHPGPWAARGWFTSQLSGWTGPSLLLGNAVRHCSGEKGWLPPELFNCTTVSFIDLKAMVGCALGTRGRVLGVQTPGSRGPRPALGGRLRLPFQISARVWVCRLGAPGFGPPAHSCPHPALSLIHLGSFSRCF